jgi:hypothetical protein
VTGAESYEQQGEQVTVRGRDALLAHVAAALVARGQAPTDLRVEMPTLEDVYMGFVEVQPNESRPSA